MDADSQGHTLFKKIVVLIPVNAPKWLHMIPEDHFVTLFMKPVMVTISVFENYGLYW